MDIFFSSKLIYFSPLKQFCIRDCHQKQIVAHSAHAQSQKEATLHIIDLTIPHIIEVEVDDIFRFFYLELLC